MLPVTCQGSLCAHCACLKDSKLNLQALDDFIKTAHSKTPENIPVLQKASAECVEKVKSIADECKMAYSYVKCFMDKH
ncbi:uncharacterized protein LOC144478183 [Augochlora pura]